MRKLRIALFFIFAALSSTWAQTFDIFKNGELLAGNPATADFVYKDSDVFSVQPGEEWCWALTAAPTICFSETDNYTPKILVNPDEEYTLNVIITRKSDGASRLLNLTIKKRFCQITWNFDNGQANRIDEVQYGTMPVQPSDPEKPSTAQYDYVFAEWSPEITAVTGPATYTALFAPITREYFITWIVEENSTTTKADYGATPTFSPTPTKSSTVESDYVFAGWSPAITAVIEPVAYTAQFTPKPRKYTITWIVEGNFTTTQADYGTRPAFSSTPTKTSTEQYNYVFAGWTPAIAEVTGLATYTAEFDSTFRKYAVTWKFENGLSDQIDSVSYGTPPTLPANPTKSPTAAYSYAFAQWMPAPTAPVTEPMAFTAQYTQTPVNYSIAYNSNGGTNVPSSSYNINSGPISLPATTKLCIEFEGWHDNPSFTGEPIAIFTPNANNLGNKTFYAKWKDKMTPSVSDLTYAIPTLTYNGAEQPITAPGLNSNAVACNLNPPTILYNGTNSLPKNAGTYAISASFAESSNYNAATILLGTLVIDKAVVPSPDIFATVSDKVYDTSILAQITSFSASQLLESDRISPSDYSIISANFDNENVGSEKTVTISFAWNNLQNYSTQQWTTTFVTTASITQATGYLIIETPKKYELSNPIKSSVLEKNSFIKDDAIVWEYRHINNANYSQALPNRVGDWMVRASFDGTNNYTGAADSARFLVERGNATNIIHNIKFEETVFEKDAAMSASLRNYYVANSCNMDSTNISITVIEPDIVFILRNNPQPLRGEQDENGSTYYEIPFLFSKPGVDTLIYTLLSKDGIYSEQDTILMELPITFDSIARQKWNNVLYINNNLLTNGGYEFAEYQWFKNGNAVSEMQFYSAGPSVLDTLNPSDVYKVTMHTANGMRISTCEGSPLAPKANEAPARRYKKQVLGINGKTAKIGAKVYNMNGSKTEKTPAGLYIVGENE
ncbi:MAG: InlB B-repeat-containing protein [Fibromonadales bacterium]|nr:InlB B-repeat-containing protein [Fibromonadales bacterium]